MSDEDAAAAIVGDFIVDYLRARGPAPRVVVNLWPGEGALLRQIAAALEPSRAIGVGATGRPPAADGVEWVADDAWSFFGHAPPELDAVIGVPPWRWQPRPVTMQGPRGEVTILDDPLNATILRSCTLLPSSGVGLFVVAPGFVLRPGPRTAFPALRRLNLTLEALVTLPRGAFVPDTGSGRFLVALTPGRPGVPVCGTLTADAAGMASLLDAVARGTAGRKALDDQAAASLSRRRS